jgi:hypothetical protein
VFPQDVGAYLSHPILPKSGVLTYRLMHTNGERTRDRTTDPTSTQHQTNRVTVADAARLMGLSAEAVRMRIKRGTLASEKIDGTVFVVLEADPTRPNSERTEDQTAERTSEQTTDQTDLVDALRSEVAFLREELKDREEIRAEENRRKDTIIAQLTQRIPALPSSASSEDSEGHDAATERAEGSEIPPETQEPSERRSWLSRFFFGP